MRVIRKINDLTKEGYGGKSTSVTIRRLQKSGRLKEYMVDGYLAYDTDEYEAYLDRCHVGRPKGMNRIMGYTLNNVLQYGVEPKNKEERAFLEKVLEKLEYELRGKRD